MYGEIGCSELSVHNIYKSNVCYSSSLSLIWIRVWCHNSIFQPGKTANKQMQMYELSVDMDSDVKPIFIAYLQTEYGWADNVWIY